LGATAGLASLALPAAAAAQATGEEAANLKLVRDFIASWTAPDFVPDKSLTPYLAPDVTVRFSENAPPVTGSATIASLWNGFNSKGEKGIVKLVGSTAMGPIVLAHRVETVVAPGKPDVTHEMVGVFFIKNGKIAQWNDYIMR
jgi:limonene-1,2-epoxide hydrolase